MITMLGRRQMLAAIATSSLAAALPAATFAQADDAADGYQVQEMFLGDADAPVDSHRVEKLRQAIADGSYRVDADRIAGKLLDIERAARKD